MTSSLFAGFLDGDLLGGFGPNAKDPFPYHGQLAIPLILSNHPGIRLDSRSDNLVGNIDIPATVLDIAGSKRAIGMSRSLIAQAQPDVKCPRHVNFGGQQSLMISHRAVLPNYKTDVDRRNSSSRLLMHTAKYLP